MSEYKKFDFVKINRHARDLRVNMTESEKMLWHELRGRKLSGYKFLRQHVILYKGNLNRYNYFIADFYCFEKKVVIELAGPVHNDTEEYDIYKDSELMELGFKVLRIKNEELVNMNEVLKKISVFLNQRD
jgi:very-short-patch-repair endonuclease